MSMYYYSMWQHFEIEMGENFARNMAAKWFFIWLLLIYVVIVDRREKEKKKDGKGNTSMALVGKAGFSL